MKRHGIIMHAVFVITAAMLFTLAAFTPAAAQQGPPPMYGLPPDDGMFAQFGGPDRPMPPGQPGQPDRPMQPGQPGQPGQQERGMRPGQPEMAPPMPEKEANETLAKIKEEEPDLYNDLIKLKDRDPMAYNNILSNYRRESQQLERLKKENPAEYENAMKMRSLNKKERELSRKYRDASDSEKKRIENELKPVMEELFDLNLAQRQKEIEMLEKRIKEVKADVEKRRNNKSAIIKRHFDELTGVTEDLRW